MSLVQNLGNPHEFIAYVIYGDGQQAVRYDMSNVSLNVWNYEPLWGAIITHTTEATPPRGLYLADIPSSFRWTYPAHGPVVWTPSVIADPTPTPLNSVPEPSTRSFTILAISLLALALLIKAIRVDQRRGW